MKKTILVVLLFALGGVIFAQWGRTEKGGRRMGWQRGHFQGQGPMRPMGRSGNFDRDFKGQGRFQGRKAIGQCQNECQGPRQLRRGKGAGHRPQGRMQMQRRRGTGHRPRGPMQMQRRRGTGQGPRGPMQMQHRRGTGRGPRGPMQMQRRRGTGQGPRRPMQMQRRRGIGQGPGRPMQKKNRRGVCPKCEGFSPEEKPGQ